MAERVKPTTYLLPHEVTLAQQAVARFNERRSAAVQDAKEALEACGDWAENGPVEAARDGANLATEGAKPYLAALNESTRIAYPDPADERIQPGSYVRVTTLGERLGYLVVGLKLVYDMELPADPEVEDVMVITPAAPLGGALLGKVSGETFSYSNDRGRTFGGTIEAVDQELIARTFGPLVAAEVALPEAV